MPPRFWDTQDTIVARASAPGGAVRGVIRLTGPAAVSLSGRICQPHDGVLQTTSPRAFRVSLNIPPLFRKVPALVLVWPDQKSYTRQPSVEIHTIGAAPILDAIQASLCESGARLAEPGEFTLRAFLAGRLDLTQAEAVLGVIDAEGDEELKMALDQLAGGLATPLHRVRDQLLDLLSHLEAGLDFVDEDIEFISAEELDAHLGRAIDDLAELQEQLDARQDFSELPSVVLCGPPNAGKSSLFNGLLNRNAAIVSPQRGATRDYVGERLQLSPTRWCRLIDTAGVDNEVVGPDAIAQESSRNARRRAALRIWCLDGDAPAPAADERTMLVVTKCDLGQSPRQYPDLLATSALEGEGLSELRAAILARLEQLSSRHGAEAAAARCGESLRLAGEALERANYAARESAGEELVAAELRLALDELGRVVGAIYNDDVLDRVFSRFCIGK